MRHPVTWSAYKNLSQISYFKYKDIKEANILPKSCVVACASVQYKCSTTLSQRSRLEFCTVNITTLRMSSLHVNLSTVTFHEKRLAKFDFHKYLQDYLCYWQPIIVFSYLFFSCLHVHYIIITDVNRK